MFCFNGHLPATLKFPNPTLYCKKTRQVNFNLRHFIISIAFTSPNLCLLCQSNPLLQQRLVFFPIHGVPTYPSTSPIQRPNITQSTSLTSATPRLCRTDVSWKSTSIRRRVFAPRQQHHSDGLGARINKQSRSVCCLQKNVCKTFRSAAGSDIPRRYTFKTSRTYFSFFLFLYTCNT